MLPHAYIFLRHCRSLRFPVITVLVISLTPLPIRSQTVWFKYERNPVLDIGKPGSWDASDVSSPRVIRDHDTLKLWYSGANYGKNYARIGYAWSIDEGITWTRYPSNPVLTVTQDWENGWTYSPFVIREGKRLKMWYTANDGFGHIGYAWSSDGVVWNKYSGNPVLRPAAQSRSWDERWIAWPSVLTSRASRSLMMWFEAHSTDLSRSQIGFATSPDETSWTRASEPALAPTPTSWDSRHVRMARILIADSIYMMWYNGGGHFYLDHQIGYATSLDGIHWTKLDTPVLSPGPARWERGGLESPDVMFDGRMFLMWYAGREDTTRTTRLGYAISPRGVDATITHANDYVTPGKDSVIISVRVDDPRGLHFEASIGSIDNAIESITHEIASIPLFDDGQHGDGAKDDGVFSAEWSPSKEDDYQVDIVLLSETCRSARFRLTAVGRFTSRGPVHIDWPLSSSVQEVSPGDTLELVLTLGNSGATRLARDITTRLSSKITGITVLDTTLPNYGNIEPSSHALPNGHHALYVSPDVGTGQTIAINLDIMSSGMPLWHELVPLYIRAPWWRSGWSYGVYSLVLLIIFGLIFRYVERQRLNRRIAALEREQHIQKERNRISRDMHDEIGALLTEISILTELARRIPGQRDNYLDQISSLSGQVIDNMGQIIWAVNPKNDSLDNLIAYIRRYAVKTLEVAGIKVSFASPENIPPYPMSAEARRNIFLVVKEALHNTVKHSKATSVDVKIVLTEGRLSITMQDDGVGFDPGQKSEHGNGMHNMRTRIEAIGGTFRIDSAPGDGTIVRLEVTCTSFESEGNT